MNTNYLFNVREWSGKHYSSSLEINEAFMKGLIDRKVEPTTYGANYTFTTKEGVLICSFYKDSSFGFCSQAYGREVPAPHVMFPAVKTEMNNWLSSKGLQPIQ